MGDNNYTDMTLAQLEDIRDDLIEELERLDDYADKRGTPLVHDEDLALTKLTLVKTEIEKRGNDGR